MATKQVECWQNVDRTLVECWQNVGRTLVEHWQNVDRMLENVGRMLENIGERWRTFSKTQILSEGMYRQHQKVLLKFRGFSEISSQAKIDFSYLVTQRVNKFAMFEIEHWWNIGGTQMESWWYVGVVEGWQNISRTLVEHWQNCPIQ